MSKHIEIGIPAILPLAIARLEVEGGIKSVILGVTLQHPPIHFLVASAQEMTIYGPRADVTRHHAETYAEQKKALRPVEIRIDNSSPSLVGFGSDDMIALGAAQAVAWVNGLAYEDIEGLAKDTAVITQNPLAFRAFERGGFLLVELETKTGELPAVLRHHTLDHRDHQAWAFVYHFPKSPEGVSEQIEQERMDVLKTAVNHMPIQTGQIIVDELWPALEADDIEAFGEALMKVRAINKTVMGEQDLWPKMEESGQQVCDVFANNESIVAHGESLTGIGVFALCRGSLASQEIRKQLLKDVGYFAGQYDATVSDRDGAKVTTKDEDLHLHDYPLPNARDGISGPRRTQ